jgi:ATP-dependent DNA ligase
MNSLEAVISSFELVRKASGRNAKLDIIKQLAKDDDEDILRTLLIYTFHPYWNYWIKLKLDDYKYKASSKVKVINWTRFVTILDKLKDRKVTGNKARTLVTNYLDSLPNRAAYWFVQVLNRKLELKLQLKSFEKFYRDLVPKTCPMLATAWKRDDLKAEHAIEYKYDGERALVIYDGAGRGTVISRNGMPKTNCEHIIEELKDNEFAKVVFDGELVGATWGAGGASRSKKKSKEKLVYKVFDILSLEDWEKRKNKMFYMDRREWLAELDLETEHVKLSEIIAKGQFTAKQLLAIGNKAIKDGYEGIMAKRLRGLYLFKRDADWLKFKYKTTDDLRIVGVKEGKHRLKGSLGALKLKGKIDKTRVETWMGQGIKDKQRKELWKLHKQGNLIGTIVEIEHYGLTSLLRAKKGTAESALRNPVLKFVKVRNDKANR